MSPARYAQHGPILIRRRGLASEQAGDVTRHVEHLEVVLQLLVAVRVRPLRVLRPDANVQTHRGGERRQIRPARPAAQTLITDVGSIWRIDHQTVVERRAVQHVHVRNEVVAETGTLRFQHKRMGLDRRDVVRCIDALPIAPLILSIVVR